MNKLLIFLLSLSLIPLCASAATIRVPADRPNIQAGINAASDGDTVLVADGTYTGYGNWDISFAGKAILLRSENGPANCIIDATGRRNGFTIFRGESRRTVVSGLKIINARYWGIEIIDASPTINNCIVEGNDGGIKVRGEELLVDVLIRKTRVRDNDDVGITVSYAQATVIDSVISDNGIGSSSALGGVYTYLSTITLENCIIKRNVSTEDGGGLYCGSGYQFTDYCIARMTNCTVVDNIAEGYGGGVCTHPVTWLTMKNCIFTGNSAGTGDQLAFFDWYYVPSDIWLAYCDVVGGIYDECFVYMGPTVLHKDPLFVTGPGGAFCISQTAAGQAADSPCVDTGDPDKPMIHGTTRTDSVLDSGVVDMGYHYPDPEEGPLPDTLIISGPGTRGSTRCTSQVAIFTFTGIDPDHDTSVLQYSWRINDEPWSVWSSDTRAIIGGLDEASPDMVIEVRARDPQGDIDPTPARQGFFYDESWVLDDLTSLVIGPGPGPHNPPLVWTSLGQWIAYGAMSYGVNLAAGDIDGDGTDEVITGPGPGRIFGPHVRCFQPDGTVINNASVMAYGTLRYGVKVAAGDVDGDGTDEIITGPGPGAVFGPHVRGWNWDSGPSLTPIPGINFFAYGTLRWGVNVACGDINNDGIDEIITGAGPSVEFGPHVRGWRFDGSTTFPVKGVNFFAFPANQWGVNVACGDVDGDGRDEIITGLGPGYSLGPRIRAWDYAAGEITQVPGVDFYANDYYHFGAVVSSADVYGSDGRDDILVMPGPGPSSTARLRAWYLYNGVIHQCSVPWLGTFFDPWMTHGGTVAGSKNGWE